MTTPDYEQMIREEIRGLPTDALAQVAEFVHLLRQRILDNQSDEEEIHAAWLRMLTAQLSRHEQEHLEKEFERYDELYPVE